MSYLEFPSLISLSQTSTRGALITRDLRFRSVTFGGDGGQVDSDKLNNYCEYVLLHELAHNIRRITVGAHVLTGAGNPIDGPPLCFTLSTPLGSVLKALIMHAVRLESLSFHCDKKSTDSFLVDPHLVDMLNARPLSELSVTGATTHVIEALRSIQRLRVLRLIIEPVWPPRGPSKPVTTDLSHTLRRSSSTLTQLTISCLSANILLNPFEPPMVFPRVHSFSWNVHLPAGLSPADLHRTFPALRSLASAAGCLSRPPGSNDFQHSTSRLSAISGDGRLINGYYGLGGLQHIMPMSPFAFDAGNALQSFCISARILLQGYSALEPILEQLPFLQIYDIPIAGVSCFMSFLLKLIYMLTSTLARPSALSRRAPFFSSVLFVPVQTVVSRRG